MRMFSRFAAVDVGEVALQFVAVDVVVARARRRCCRCRGGCWSPSPRRLTRDDQHRGQGEAPPEALRLRRRLVVALGRRLLRSPAGPGRSLSRRAGPGSRAGRRRASAGRSRSEETETHSSGPWWPSPTGPNSTAGTPTRRKETASEAPSRPTLIGSPSWCARRRLAQRPHEGRVAVDDGRRAGEERRRPRRRGRPAHLLQDRGRVLLGQVADVDVDHASVGHLVERVAAPDPAEVDRGAVEQLRAVPGKR